MSGTAHFPATDWRFNEFPNPAAHALYVTCVELMALPVAPDAVANFLLDVVAKGYHFSYLKICIWDLQFYCSRTQQKLLVILYNFNFIIYLIHTQIYCCSIRRDTFMDKLCWIITGGVTRMLLVSVAQTFAGDYQQPRLDQLAIQ